MASTTYKDSRQPEGRTRLLARLASGLTYEELPAPVVERAKTCILDTLGAILLGSLQPWGKIMLQYVSAQGGKTESLVAGSSVRVSAGNAALANGTMGHGFEVDDVYIPGIHHPGVVIVPAALAAGEREGSSGKEFIAAVVAGYDVMNRVGAAAGKSHMMRGYFPTGTNGAFGAAAAAGRLVHLSEEQMTDALGIAGCQAAGLFEGVKEGRMTKRFGAGRAAQSGLLAADLARLGFTGPTTAVEGEWGYLKAFSDQPDHSGLTEGLGKSYTILETTFKPYPCCKALHAAIDGALELNAQHHFDPEQVSEVIIGGYEKLVKMHDVYEPSSPMAAQFSMPYVVSVTLLKGVPVLESFEERNIRDARVLKFAEKVRTIIDPEVESYFPPHVPSKVTVKLKNGKSYSKTVIHAKGTPENPMSPGELETKFRSFASKVIPAEQAERAIERIQKMEELSNIPELSSCLEKKD